MPMPIRPAGDKPVSSWGETESQDLFTMNLDALAGAAVLGGMGRSGSIHVNAEATDRDAEILLDLFNRGRIVAEAEATEDKKYAVPEDFSGDKLLRLKAASLVSGDTSIIKFTSKAVRVIKTLVLAEQNAYTKTSVQKPYSVILAENKSKSASRSTLAFERTASVIATAQRNMPIDEAFMPTRDTPYIASRRVVMREGTSNKHYIVRIFNVNGQYPVLAWNGRNERGKPLVMQPKGLFRSRAQAQAVFDDLISSKRREGYEVSSETDHPSLLGTSAPEEAPSPRPNPRPTPTARPAARPAAEPSARPSARPAAEPSPRSAPPPPSAAPDTNPVSTESKKPIETLPFEQYIDTLLSDLDDDDDFNF